MKHKNLIFTLILLMTFITPVKAESCDKKDIDRLTNLANHIDISYFREEHSEELISQEGETYQSDTIKDDYIISIANLTEDLYAKVNNEEIYFYPKDAQEGIVSYKYLSGGTYDIDIYSNTCSTKLNTITITLPKYNSYAKLCEGISAEELNVCDEWYQGELSLKTFEQEIDNYKKEQSEKNNLNIKEIFNQYSIYFIFGIIAIAIIALLIIIQKRRSVLK